jgi:hypothetical protein
MHVASLSRARAHKVQAYRRMEHCKAGGLTYSLATRQSHFSQKNIFKHAVSWLEVILSQLSRAQSRRQRRPARSTRFGLTSP